MWGLNCLVGNLRFKIKENKRFTREVFLKVDGLLILYFEKGVASVWVMVVVVLSRFLIYLSV